MKKILLLLSFIGAFSVVKAQDMLSSLGESDEPDYSIASFKSTRLINQHTIEVCGPHTMDFRISHRFGAINAGSYNAWGLDGTANIRIGLEYSPNGRLMFGIGRSSSEKLVDGFLKYRILRQRTNGGMPVSVTLFAGAYYTTLKDLNKSATGYDKYEHTSARMSYCYELLIGRKFSPSFSFQVAPYFVHYNQVELKTEKNDSYGVSALFRMKFTARAAITAEYAYRMSDYTANKTRSADDKYFDSFSIGYEVETGGHVFQIQFTNSFGMAESQFFQHTTSKWNNAGIRLGFNISRVFTIGGDEGGPSFEAH